MAPETVSWKNNEGRGTWDILSSCVLTLVLCVWTALHLNVPKQHSTLWDRFKTKALWVIVGIFAPEVVVYLAWVQYSSAKYLLQQIRDLGADGIDLSSQKSRCRGEEDPETTAPPASAPKKHKWTISHCFFAGMGGFAFDSDIHNGGQEFLPGSPSLRFTSHAILMLAKLDRLPNVSSADISDKSKADGLAKSLVCLQATWMLLQCIGRLAARLPITLLEINTVGHCFCTLIIYLIWWNKPLHVLEPIILDGEFMRRFTSYSYMRSPMHNESMEEVSDLWKNKTRKDRNKIAFYSEMERLTYWENGPNDENNDATFRNYRVLPNTYSKKIPSDGLILAEGDIISGLNFTINPLAVRQLEGYYHNENRFYNGENRFYPDRKFVINLTRTDVARWKLASEFLSSVKGIADEELFSDVVDYFSFYLKAQVSDFVNRQDYAFLPHTRYQILVALATASAAYGGLHLSSWNSYFPTVVERWLWMSSSIFIASIGCMPVMYELWLYLLKFITKYLPRLRITWINAYYLWEKYLKFPLALIVCPIYCFTRGFIIVEAFIAFRQLPLDYYDTPVWSNFIPHL